MNTYTDTDNQISIIFDWETLFNWVLIGEKYAKSIIGILEEEEAEAMSIRELDDKFWI